MQQKRDGFSLVEVIIAVAILAIIATPILAYFTNAAVSTSRGRDTQKANMVAQSVMEEVKSCDSFAQVEQNLVAASGSAWTITNVADIPTATNKGASVLNKNVTLDGVDYKAVVTLDYDYTAASTDEPLYNDYSVPELKEIYSTSNVVLEETDQEDTALSNYLYSNKDKTRQDIRNNMSRTICMDVVKDKSNPSNPIYTIRGYYRYNYQGEDYDAIIKSTKIESSKLRNIYLFYHLLQKNAAESVKVNYQGVSQTEAEKIQVYFICQKRTKEDGTFDEPQSTYSLFVSGEGEYMKSQYFSNGKALSGVSGKTEFVTSARAKRIAKVTVDVYDPTDASKVLVSLHTSKGV